MRRLMKIIRNILLLAIAAIVIVAGVLAFNTFTHGSRQLQVTAVSRAAVDAGAAATRLSEAIRFRTISSHEKPEQHAEALRGMQAHIQKSFPAFHAVARREVVADYSLLYTWEGSAPKNDSKAQPIALLAHQDVVPVAPGTEKDWQQPPYDGVISDGYIWGRGSWDDKGNLYSMREAAETMAKAGFRPKRTIYFAFGHDEETTGTAGAKSIAALPKPDWVLNPPKQIGNVRKFVVTSDPYLTAEECRQDADNKMQNLALNRAAELSGASLARRTGAASLADLGLGADYVRRELCTDEYIDVIDSSVGEMRKTYSLVEFNEAQDALLVDRARSYSRQEGLLDVTLIGGGVFASVATLFGLLRIDTWTRGYYTKRLFLGVPAAIITVLALLMA